MLRLSLLLILNADVALQEQSSEHEEIHRPEEEMLFASGNNRHPCCATAIKCVLYIF